MKNLLRLSGLLRQERKPMAVRNPQTQQTKLTLDVLEGERPMTNRERWLDYQWRLFRYEENQRGEMR